MNIINFITRYPRLYHMAEAGTWGSIQQHGLLSTSAILDFHSIVGDARLPYESNHRPEMMTVESKAHTPIIIRDQKPMAENRLRLALGEKITPNDWYRFLNNKVFFWATEERLHKLLNAKFYKEMVHDVLTIDTSSFMNEYEDQVNICHMNSGNTWPMPHPRDFGVFKSINDYPTKTTGGPVREVAEVTIQYSVPNVTSHVIEVNKMLGSQKIESIYIRP
jgi:hypothetical protein